MKDEQIAILDFLKQNAMGIDNAIKIEDIATAIGVPPQGTNNDNVRKWIKELVGTYQQCIGTYEKGAFIITNDEECDLAVKYLERKNLGPTLRNNWNNFSK